MIYIGGPDLCNMLTNVDVLPQEKHHMRDLQTQYHTNRDHYLQSPNLQSVATEVGRVASWALLHAAI